MRRIFAFGVLAVLSISSAVSAQEAGIEPVIHVYNTNPEWGPEPGTRDL